MNSRILSLFPALLLLFSAALRAAPSDPTAEMAAFSVFGKVDLVQLANGEVKTAAGAPMSTARYLSVQSCFVVPQPPAKVIDAMKRFDPTAHRELKVYLHSDLPTSPTAAKARSGPIFIGSCSKSKTKACSLSGRPTCDLRVAAAFRSPTDSITRAAATTSHSHYIKCGRSISAGTLAHSSGGAISSPR